MAAYPVKGPVDVCLFETGAMNPDINTAISTALMLDREICAKTAQDRHSWPAAWRQFRANLVDHTDQQNMFDVIF